MFEAGVFTSDRAISTLDDHHIKRTLYDHQVSLVALSFSKEHTYSNTGLFEDRFDKQSREGLTCKYCSLIIEVDIIICRLCTLLEMVILSSMPWMNCVAGF